MRRRGARRHGLGRSVALAVAAGALSGALAGGCRGGASPAPEPGAAGLPAPSAQRVATPDVPVYEGCYVTFDGEAAPSGAPDGALVLQLAADPASMGGFRTIDIEILDCAGANRGAVRDVGWTRVPTTVGRATLDVASGAAVTVAEGSLPPGSWDRVFVAVPRAWGVAADGGRAALEAYVEPIARGFVLPPGGRVTVTMQLTIRARPAAWRGDWNLFTKDAWLTADETLGP